MAAEHLLRGDRRLEAEVGEGGLHHRGEQRHERVRLTAGLRVRMPGGDVHLQRRPHRERTGRLDEGAAGQQHLAHVGMGDDRNRTAPAVRRAPLQPLPGIGDRLLVGHLRDAEALHADHQPLGVHHGEHGGEAAPGLADEPAGGAVVVHHAGRLGVDAHLVLERADRHGVAGAEAAVRPGQELRAEEQADALHALRRVGQACEHEVDDVAAEVVVAGGDEDLGPGDRVAPVAVRDRARGEQAEIGARPTPRSAPWRRSTRRRSSSAGRPPSAPRSRALRSPRRHRG